MKALKIKSEELKPGDIVLYDANQRKFINENYVVESVQLNHKMIGDGIYHTIHYTNGRHGYWLATMDVDIIPRKLAILL
jgi:hypothetical protein